MPLSYVPSTVHLRIQVYFSSENMLHYTQKLTATYTENKDVES